MADYTIEIIHRKAKDGSADIADDAMVGMICISNDSGGGAIGIPDEADTAATFDASDNYASGLQCRELLQDGVVTTNGTGKGVFATLVFAAGTHLANGEVVDLVGICQADGDTNYGENLAGCALGNGGSGLLFAIFDPTPVTLEAGETVDITYEFDISVNQG